MTEPPMRTLDAAARTGSWIDRLLNFARHGDTFVASTPAHGDEDRLFGGLIAAQALGAAGATVPADKVPQSLHAYFLRGGHYGTDVVIDVERVRDGKSFATRRVTVTQDDAAIFEMITSFHRPEHSAEHHQPLTSAPTLGECVTAARGLTISRLFDIRAQPENAVLWAIPPFWIRSHEPVPDDALTRACVLTFLSDIGPVPIARPPSNGDDTSTAAGFSASLDHAIWFHRSFDPREWHCYDVTALNHSRALGLVRGSLYHHSGALIATTSQEALWRI